MTVRCSKRPLQQWLAISTLAALLTTAPPATAQTLADENLLIQTVVAGLELPTSIVFLDDRTFLVGEKNTGRVRVVRDGTIVGTALDLPVATNDTHGLLGLTVAPDFDQNGRVYIYYSRATADGEPWLENVVESYRLIDDELDVTSRQPIVQFARDTGQANASCEGGKLAFGSDGMLYGTTGDLSRGDFENPRIEQNTDAGATAAIGGIFRVTPTGDVPADNPFANHPNPMVRRWFAVGVRQSFGLDFDPITDELWISENGPEVYDEVSRVLPGYNSGWLLIMGPDERNATYERNDFLTFDAQDLIPLTGSRYEDPKVSFLQPIGATALVFIDSVRFPAYLRNQMLVGDTNFGNLYRLAPADTRDALDLPAAVADDLVADSVAERNTLVFGTDWGITTDMKLGPDGFLYHVSLLDGTIRRIRPRIQTADLNGDDAISESDIPAFVLALTDPAGYAKTYPQIDANLVGDTNGDGRLSVGDINGFVALLTE